MTSTPTPKQTRPKKPDAEAAPTEAALIEVPCHLSKLYASDYLNGKLTHRQARAARSVLDALQVRGGTISTANSPNSTRSIRTAFDVVRWLLERVADEMKLPDSAS